MNSTNETQNEPKQLPPPGMPPYPNKGDSDAKDAETMKRLTGELLTQLSFLASLQRLPSNLVEFSMAILVMAARILYELSEMGNHTTSIADQVKMWSYCYEQFSRIFRNNGGIDAVIEPPLAHCCYWSELLFIMEELT